MANIMDDPFQTIINGDEKESQKAVPGLRHRIYSSRQRFSKNYFHDYISSAPQLYAGLKEDWRRKNFVVAIASIYFLNNFDAPTDVFLNWLFELLQHENGIFRFAAVRMFNHELGPLTVHIRHPLRKSHYPGLQNSEVADDILASIFLRLNNLQNHFWQSRYARYKYIQSLPASQYKSAQMILATFYDFCGEEYMTHLSNRFHLVEMKH